MVSGSAIVKNDKGIHARPSSEISIESQKYSSQITLKYNGNVANSRDVLQIIILELFKGVEVEIEAEGEDEQAALDAIKAMIEKTFDYD